MVTVPQLGEQPGVVASVDIDGRLLVDLGAFAADQSIALNGDSRTLVRLSCLLLSVSGSEIPLPYAWESVLVWRAEEGCKVLLGFPGEARRHGEQLPSLGDRDKLGKCHRRHQCKTTQR